MSEVANFPRAVLKARYPDTPLHGDFTTIEAGQYELIGILAGGTPCQSFSVSGLRQGLADDRGNLAREFLGGLFGKTSPASCRQTAELILVPYSEGWANSGMGSHIEFLTLNTSEHNDFPEPFHSDGGVCSLSDILETGDVPPRFYLSARACAGIIRRAEKRGKTLPDQLAEALKAAAFEQQT